MNFENFEYKKPSITDSTDEEVSQNYVENLKLTPKDFGKKILGQKNWDEYHQIGLGVLARLVAEQAADQRDVTEQRCFALHVVD